MSLYYASSENARKKMIDAAMSSCYDRAEIILEEDWETRHLW